MKIVRCDRFCRKRSFDSTGGNVEDFDFEGVHFYAEGVGDGLDRCFG